MASQAVPLSGAEVPQDARWSMRAIAVAGCGILLVHLWFALTRSINWDEFHHFDHVRQYAAGTLTAPLQTFYVHLFGWTLWVPGDATVQIRAARLAMLACTSGAALALFGVAQRFASKQAAALAALAWLTGGYVLGHATAFRADPIAALLLMSALWLLACKPLNPRSALVAGLVAGLSAAVTIKSAIYAPAFLAIFLLRWREAGPLSALRHFALAGTAALGTFALLYLWHRSHLPYSPYTAGGEIASSAQDRVLSEGWLPRWHFIKHQMLLGPHIVALVAAAPLAWWLARFDWVRWCSLVLLLSPLLTLLVYRNAFPYYFVFLLPPVLVATAPVFERLLGRLHPAIPALAMVIWAIKAVQPPAAPTLEGQRQTIAAVNRMFPQPVAYIDFAASLGDHRRAVPFMLSGWGLADYRKLGEPQLRQRMEREPVPLLLVNHQVLDAAMTAEALPERLLEADAAALRANYIAHWGRVHVAGKAIAPGSDPIDAEFLVPGTYTLEQAPLTIDGVARRPGDFVTLQRGVHRIGGERSDAAILRWGRNLPVPSAPPPSAPPFDEF